MPVNAGSVWVVQVAPPLELILYSVFAVPAKVTEVPLVATELTAGASGVAEGAQVNVDQALALIVSVLLVLCWKRYVVAPTMLLNVVPVCTAVQFIPLSGLILYSVFAIVLRVTDTPPIPTLDIPGAAGVAAAESVRLADQLLAAWVWVCTVRCWTR